MHEGEVKKKKGSAAPGVMCIVEIRCVLYGARMCEPRPGPSV